MSTAEAFHRDLTKDVEGNEPVPTQVFHAVPAAALKCVTRETHRTRFRHWFNRNEPSLKERLVDLVAHLPKGTV